MAFRQSIQRSTSCNKLVRTYQINELNYVCTVETVVKVQQRNCESVLSKGNGRVLN